MVYKTIPLIKRSKVFKRYCFFKREIVFRMCTHLVSTFVYTRDLKHEYMFHTLLSLKGKGWDVK